MDLNWFGQVSVSFDRFVYVCIGLVRIGKVLYRFVLVLDSSGQVRIGLDRFWKCFGLVWIGSDWIGWFGLVWIGLDWFGLVQIGLDWFGLD